MGEDRVQMPHKLTLNERRQLSMSGVSEVVSFDESAVVLRTQLGILTIHGKDLQLKISRWKAVRWPWTAPFPR